MVVLMFLYTLKLRVKRPGGLLETPLQLGNPEKNLYLQSGNLKRFPARYPVAASLPFFGEWEVSQGHDGEITHKGAWGNAWDFIISDYRSRQFKEKGDFAEDYFCFCKAIVAPFDGTMAEVVSSIPDNIIGDVDIRNNLGNTVILKRWRSSLLHKFHRKEGVTTLLVFSGIVQSSPQLCSQLQNPGPDTGQHDVRRSTEIYPGFYCSGLSVFKS